MTLTQSQSSSGDANGNVIELNNLTKHYGDVVGIQDLSLEVEQGEVFGLLGPNGAGKTTTIRLLLDFIRPTSGSATVFGLDPRNDGVEMRRRIGYLPGDFITYNYMTGAEVATYFTNLRGTDPVKMEELCERFDLDPSRKIRELSRGNRQKVGLVQAFMNDPDLLILDEPTSGLDPLLQHEFQEMVHEEKERGKTIFLSSHVMSEVEATCDRVCIIREGSLVTLETVSDLTALNVFMVTVEFEGGVDTSPFHNLPGVNISNETDSSISMAVSGDGAMDSVIKAASQHTVRRLESGHATLEDVFLQFYSAD